MKLENLYTNFLSLTDAEQLDFVSSYRKQRIIDLTPVIKQKDISKSDTSLSPEETALCKMLGLTKKDYLILKRMQVTEKDEEEEDGNNSTT